MPEQVAYVDTVTGPRYYVFLRFEPNLRCYLSDDKTRATPINEREMERVKRLGKKIKFRKDLNEWKRTPEAKKPLY